MRQTDRTRNRKLYRLSLVWVLLIVLGSISASPALAQNGASPAELRRANDQLRERITELEAALSESRRRIEALESRVEEFTKKPEDLQQDVPDPIPTPADPADRPIPTEPSSCPDALYGSLVDNYNEAFPGIEIPAFAEVQQWIDRVRHERQRITWLIEVHEIIAVRGKDSSLRVNLIDPESGDAICGNFILPVSYTEAVRIGDATGIMVWECSGTFTANPIADRSRPEFDNEMTPRLIGPFAVFGWTFDVQRIKPVEQTDDPGETEPLQR